MVGKEVVVGLIVERYKSAPNVERSGETGSCPEYSPDDPFLPGRRGWRCRFCSYALCVILDSRLGTVRDAEMTIHP